ncbi:MAG: hypothetical protein OEV42_14765 [Deltaproteobacteria bacterium]|nr:hypothetical protein [Deltaproteobacteria bacterium]
MALNKAVLEAAIITEIQAQGFDTANEHSKFPQLAKAIANAVVDHFTANAVVTTTSGAPDEEHTGVIS